MWVGIRRNPKNCLRDKIWMIREIKKKRWKRKILKITIAEIMSEIFRNMNENIFYKEIKTRI